MKNQQDKVLELIRQSNILRSRDLEQHGIPRMTLSRLADKGLIERVGRGIYVLADGQVTEHHTLAEASKRVPQGIICLLSALAYHGLTTQAPFEIWMAIPVRMRKPNVDYPPLRIVRSSGKSLTHGVEAREIEGVMVKITSPAKTVVDCFKFRNKIGIDVAIEALRDYRRTQSGNVDALWDAARVCRVTSVMRPYMEAVG